MVLLVEDNPTDVFVIKEVLESSGLNLGIHVTTNGQEALVYLRDLTRDQKAVCPVLVLLDLNLPKVTGIEVLRELRASRCSRTPVIVVTSSSAETDRYTAQQLGATAYFQKPTTLAEYMELAELIKRVLDTQ